MQKYFMCIRLQIALSAHFFCLGDIDLKSYLCVFRLIVET